MRDALTPDQQVQDGIKNNHHNFIVDFPESGKLWSIRVANLEEPITIDTCTFPVGRSISEKEKDSPKSIQQRVVALIIAETKIKNVNILSGTYNGKRMFDMLDKVPNLPA